MILKASGGYKRAAAKKIISSNNKIIEKIANEKFRRESCVCDGTQNAEKLHHPRKKKMK
jgi:hypothetical protein